MTEADVALTDYLLVIESVILAYLFWKIPTQNVRFKYFCLMIYIGLGLSAFLGGTYHGFFLNTPFGLTVLYQSTLIVIGFVTLACWLTGAELLISNKSKKIIFTFAILDFIIYSLIILSLTSKKVFYLAIINYVPSILFLMLSFCWLYKRMPNKTILLGILGPCLTIVAAVIHEVKIGIPLLSISPNAFYHIVQGLALFVFYFPVTMILRTDPTNIYKLPK